MTPRVAHLIVRDDQLTLQVPYDQDFLEDFKSTIPHQYREWLPASKVWLIECCRAELVAVCRAHFARVIIHDETPAAMTSSSDWAASMFDAVPARLHQLLYRSMSKVLHPDAGGDLVSMQALAAAYTERTAA